MISHETKLHDISEITVKRFLQWAASTPLEMDEKTRAEAHRRLEIDLATPEGKRQILSALRTMEGKPRSREIAKKTWNLLSLQFALYIEAERLLHMNDEETEPDEFVFIDDVSEQFIQDVPRMAFFVIDGVRFSLHDALQDAGLDGDWTEINRDHATQLEEITNSLQDQITTAVREAVEDPALIRWVTLHLSQVALQTLDRCCIEPSIIVSGGDARNSFELTRIGEDWLLSMRAVKERFRSFIVTDEPTGAMLGPNEVSPESSSERKATVRFRRSYDSPSPSSSGASPSSNGAAPRLQVTVLDVCDTRTLFDDNGSPLELKWPVSEAFVYLEDSLPKSLSTDPAQAIQRGLNKLIPRDPAEVFGDLLRPPTSDSD